MTCLILRRSGHGSPVTLYKVLHHISVSFHFLPVCDSWFVPLNTKGKVCLVCVLKVKEGQGCLVCVLRVKVGQEVFGMCFKGEGRTGCVWCVF